MIGPNFADEIDCGSFFDHIDDLLDFPSDDVEFGLPTGNSDVFPNIWSTPADSFPCSDSVFSGTTASDLSAELSVPYEDIVQLEWLSNFVEDSFSNGKSLTINQQDSSFTNKKSSSPSSSLHHFQTSSPISVLESSSSCSGGKTAPGSPETITPAGKRGRSRSKRTRPATFNPRLPIVSPTSDSENFAESNVKIPKQKKKIRMSPIPVSPIEATTQNPATTQSVRKCRHCEITKTPQWRAGPLGPKTLCNACGVRYKSGRLFPEYRPAASPTFVPSLHSNSHKKVVEMRNNPNMTGTGTATSTSTAEVVPDSNIV